MTRALFEALHLGNLPLDLHSSLALRAAGFTLVEGRGGLAWDEELPDLLIVEPTETGEIALDVWKRRGGGPALGLIELDASASTCAGLVERGVTELVTKPVLPQDLLRAAERLVRTSWEVSSKTWRRRFQASYAAEHSDGDIIAEPTPCTVSPITEEITRSLGAWAMAQGIGPAARARLCAASAEVVENAALHGYVGCGGPIDVRARGDQRRVVVEIVDRGRGFDPYLELELEETARAGLSRAAALSEGMRIDTQPNAGTYVELEFHASSAVFDEAELDLSDDDWLAGSLARRVLGSIATDTPVTLSPALAVSVGRLLARPDKGRAALTLLRSTS